MSIILPLSISWPCLNLPPSPGGQFPAGQCILLVGIGQARGYPDQSKQQLQGEKNIGVRPPNISNGGVAAGVSDFIYFMI